MEHGRFFTTFPEKVEEERDMVVVAIGVLTPVSPVCVFQESCECGDGLIGYEKMVFKAAEVTLGIDLLYEQTR